MKFGKTFDEEIHDLEGLKTTTTVRNDLLPFLKYKHLKSVIKGKDSALSQASVDVPLGASMECQTATQKNHEFFAELDSAVEELDSFFTRLTLNLTPKLPSPSKPKASPPAPKTIKVSTTRASPAAGSRSLSPPRSAKPTAKAPSTKSRSRSPPSTNKKQQPTKSKHPGVIWNRSRRKWQAQPWIKGKSRYIGLYKTEEEAWQAIVEAKAKANGSEPPPAARTTTSATSVPTVSSTPMAVGDNAPLSEPFSPTSVAPTASGFSVASDTKRFKTAFETIPMTVEPFPASATPRMIEDPDVDADANGSDEMDGLILSELDTLFDEEPLVFDQIVQQTVNEFEQPQGGHAHEPAAQKRPMFGPVEDVGDDDRHYLELDVRPDTAATTAVLLLRWSQVNTQALIKITKKRDKNFGDGSGARWLSSRGQFLRIFYSPIIEKLAHIARRGLAMRPWTLTHDPERWLLATRALNTPVLPFKEYLLKIPCLTVSISMEPARSKSLAIAYGGRGHKRSRPFDEDPDCDTVPFDGAAGPLAPSASRTFEELCGIVTSPAQTGANERTTTIPQTGKSTAPPSASASRSAEAFMSTSASSSASASASWPSNEPSIFDEPTSQQVSPNVIQAVNEIQKSVADKVFVRGFGRTTLDGAAGYSLAGALLQSATDGRPGLEHLGLVGCHITNAGAWALASGIRFNRELRVLELSSCSISDMGVATIMTALTNSDVETICLSKCGITDETARMIAERLKEPSSLRQLRRVCLDDNHISRESLPHLAEAMRVNRASGGKLGAVGLKGAAGIEEQHVVNEHLDIWLGGLLMG